MNISISRDGTEIGEWTEEEVRSFYKEGRLVATDFYWREGMTEWKELGAFINPPPPFPLPAIPIDMPPPPAPKPQAERAKADIPFSNDELRKVCRGQNLLMWSVLAGVIDTILCKFSDWGLPVAVCVLVFQVYALCSLSYNLRKPYMAFACIFLVVPVISLLVLVIVSRKASYVLSCAGVGIGLMGGRANEIDD